MADHLKNTILEYSNSLSNQGYDLNQGTLTWVIFHSFGFELLLFVICSKLSQPMKKVLFVKIPYFLE